MLSDNNEPCIQNRQSDWIPKKLNWTSVLYDQYIFVDAQLYRRWDRSLNFEGQQLLNKDLIRTRSSEEYFRKQSTRNLLKRITTFYCIQNRVNYQQGLLEVVIPFALLKSRQLQTRKCYAYFNSFMKKFFPRVLTQKTIENRKELPHAILAISLSQILLNYHYPEVYQTLKASQIPLSMVITQQILTIFAKNVELPLVYEIFNFFINKNDKNYLLYMAIALIGLQANQIIHSSEDQLHSFVNKHLKQFTSLAQLQLFFSKSQEIQQRTPTSFKILSKKIGFCDKSFFTFEDYERMMGLQQSLIDSLMPVYRQEIDGEPKKYILMLINGEVPSKKYDYLRLQEKAGKLIYPKEALNGIGKERVLVFGCALKNEREQRIKIGVLIREINGESVFGFKMMILVDKLQTHHSCQLY